MQGLIPLAMLAFLMYCLLDVVRSDAAEVRTLPKRIWLVLVLLVPVLGGIAWLVTGRPAPVGSAPGTGSGGARRHAPSGGAGGPSRPRSGSPSPAPRGPDDDPEFLAQLERRLRGDDGPPGSQRPGS